MTTYSCICPAGWTGPNCDIDINECLLPLICHPNATCVNTIGSYRCLCPPWLTDFNCYTTVDLCASAPCRNGGVCVYNYGGSVTCRCPPGFTGAFCEVMQLSSDGSRGKVPSLRLTSTIANRRPVSTMEPALTKSIVSYVCVRPATTVCDAKDSSVNA